MNSYSGVIERFQPPCCVSPHCVANVQQEMRSQDLQLAQTLLGLNSEIQRLRRESCGGGAPSAVTFLRGQVRNGSTELRCDAYTQEPRGIKLRHHGEAGEMLLILGCSHKNGGITLVWI